MEQPKDAAKVRFFPPAIPLITILLGAVLSSIWPIAESFYVPAPGRYYIGGGIAVGAFLVFGLWSFLVIRSGGQSENPWKPTTHIEVRGPFRITRNPMYLQMLLVCIGVGVAINSWWILLFTPLAGCALYWLAIRPEEEYLEKKFGETYLTYKRRVRRWL